MAAYSLLASRSQAKFQTMKLSPLSAPCAAAPAQSTVSTCRSLRFSPRSCTDVNLTRTVPVAFPKHFRSKKQSQLVAAYLACQSVAGVAVYPRHIWHKTSFIPTCVKSCSLPVNKARWRNHVTDFRWVRYSWSHGSTSRDGSSSQCDRPSRMTTWQGSADKVPDSMAGRLGGFVSRGARLGSEWWARDRGRPSRHCWPSTWWWRPSRCCWPSTWWWRPSRHCWPSTWWWRPWRCGRLSTPSGLGNGRPSWDTCSGRGPSTSCQAFERRGFQVQESHDSHKFGVEGDGGGAICCPAFQVPFNPRSPWLPACMWWDGPALTGQNATDHEVGIAGRGDEPVVQGTPAGNTPAAR